MIQRIILVIAGILLVSEGLDAQNELDSLNRQLMLAKTDTAKVEILLNIGFQYELFNYDSALAVYNNAKALSRKAGFTKGLAKSEQYSGIVLTETGNFAEGINAYRRALVQYGKMGDEKGTASTTNNMGNTYLYMANYSEAVRNYLLALPYYEKENDDFALVIIHGNLGECYRQLSDYSNMLSSSRRSYRYAKKLDDPTEMANAGISLGTAYSLNGKPDSADYFLHRSYALAKDLRDDCIQFYALHDLADNAIKRGISKEALQKADSCLIAAIACQRTYNVISAHLMLGRAYELNGKSENALSEFKAALEQAKEESAREMERNALDLLSLFYEKKGNTKEALFYRNEWSAVNDSIFNSSKSRQVSELQTLYETAEKDRRIIEEKAMNAEKDEALRRRMFFIIAIALALLVIALLAFFIVRFNRNKRRLAENEATLQKQRSLMLELEAESLIKEWESEKLRSLIDGQEKERQRLGRELHDGLGGLLTAARLQLEESKKQNASRSVDEAHALIARAGKDMREMSHDLAPEGLDKLGLKESLRLYCERISTPSIRVSFESHGEEWSPGKTEEISLYRIVQELLNNVLKHSDASEAFVSLSYVDDSLSLVVEDNGRGFDPSNEKKHGKGLSGIYARAAFLKAELDTITLPGKGSSITIALRKRNG